MAESTPVLNSATPPDGPAAVQSEGAASLTSIGNGQNGINGQDIAMGGQEDSGFKTLKPGDNSALTLNSSATPAVNTTSSTTTTTNMVGRSFVPDTATGGNSRAASADRTGDRVAMPTEAATHGAPTRQYLNAKVTYHVMEGMKIVAKERPAEPLRVLGEFLLKRSKEIEGTANGNGAGTNGSAAAAPGDEAKEGDKNGDEQ